MEQFLNERYLWNNSVQIIIKNTKRHSCTVPKICLRSGFCGVSRLIDSEGFRANVGIMLANTKGEVLWARRVGQDAWQFPQGGIQEGESPDQALFRELREEVGLSQHDVEIIACTRGWLRYRLPQRLVRRGSQPLCIGQKQKWFLLKMLADDSDVVVDGGDKPEFDGWRWVSYWYPLGQVVAFKREVYRRALKELAPKHSRLVVNN